MNKVISKTKTLHAGSINSVKNDDEYIGISLIRISSVLIAYFLISNSCFGFDMIIEINKDKHCSIHLLLSKLLVTKSGSVPSAKESLFNNKVIILRHFSLFF